MTETKTLYHGTTNLDKVIRLDALPSMNRLFVMGSNPADFVKERQLIGDEDKRKYERLTSQLAECAVTERGSYADEFVRADIAVQQMGLSEIAREYMELLKCGFVHLGDYDWANRVRSWNPCAVTPHIFEMKVPISLIRPYGCESLVWWELPLEYATAIYTDDVAQVKEKVATHGLVIPVKESRMK